MTYTKHVQVYKAKESKIDDFYLLFAIFSIPLQEKVYMEATEKKERTVIHLQIGDVHEYYGSIANIYEFHSSDELGITYGSLRCATMVCPLTNRMAIINVSFGKEYYTKRQEAEAERVDYAASANSFRNLLMIILSSRFSFKVLAMK